MSKEEIPTGKDFFKAKGEEINNPDAGIKEGYLYASEYLKGAEMYARMLLEKHRDKII